MLSCPVIMFTLHSLSVTVSRTRGATPFVRSLAVRRLGASVVHGVEIPYIMVHVVLFVVLLVVYFSE